MSIVITRDVFCDGPDCSLWTHGITGRATAADARLEARRAGWKVGPQGDFCPDCRRGFNLVRTDRT